MVSNYDAKVSQPPFSEQDSSAHFVHSIFFSRIFCSRATISALQFYICALRISPAVISSVTAQFRYMEYEALKELVRLVSRHKVKDIELLGSATEESTQRKLNQYYDGISKSLFANDDEAAAALYGPKAKANHPDYRRLRNRLIRQLLNTTFFMDMHQPVYSDHARMSYQIYKDFAAAALLLSRDARQAGIYLMEQVVDLGKKYEFTEVVADGARLIRSAASGSLGNAAQHEKYTLIHREFEEKRRLESDAFEAYQYVIKHYIAGASTNKEVYQYTTDVLPKLMEKVGSVNTVNYYFYTYSIGVAHFSSINDAKNALRLCTEAIDIISQREQYPQGKMLSFILNKLHFMTQLRLFDLEEGQKTFDLCLTQVIEGETNWFKTLNIWLLFNLQAGQYATAFGIYQRAISHARYPLMTGHTAEIWTLYHGYFLLLKALGQLDIPDDPASFKAQRFTNQFLVLSKDKTGMNIPIVMLPVIFATLDKSDKQEFKTDDALDKYRQRYLQNDQNLRSAIFIKLLTALGKRPYDPAKATKKIQSELQLLAEIPIETAGQSYTVEIIPYETLWDFLDKQCK